MHFFFFNYTKDLIIQSTKQIKITFERNFETFSVDKFDPCLVRVGQYKEC